VVFKWQEFANCLSLIGPSNFIVIELFDDKTLKRI